MLTPSWKPVVYKIYTFLYLIYVQKKEALFKYEVKILTAIRKKMRTILEVEKMRLGAYASFSYISTLFLFLSRLITFEFGLKCNIPTVYFWYIAEVIRGTFFSLS